MRILILDSYYPRFLDSFIAGLDDTDRLSYRDFLAQLLKSRFGTSDFYSRHLSELGHEVEDVIFNCVPLQRKWAQENGFATGASIPVHNKLLRMLPWFRRFLANLDEMLAICLAQIRKFQPDILYLQDLNLLPPEVIADLKGSGDVRLVVGQIACPLPPRQYLRGYDLILSSFPHYVDRFRAMGIRSEYFRIGFDPVVLNETERHERDLACTFVGGISGVHGRRGKFLEELAKRVEIEFYGYGADSLPKESAIRRRHHGEAWALDMYSILSRSRITLNVHIDVAEDYANNMRLYEATGCGAMLLTDWKKNLSEMFEPGVEVETYRSVDEAEEKIRYYIEHPDEAEGIAKRGQDRTLREHTYRQRMEELSSILKSYAT